MLSTDRWRIMKTISERFEQIFNSIKTPDFLNKSTLGGEIPFFISAYPSNQETYISQNIPGLINRLEKEGIKLLTIDIYDECITILKETGRFEQVMEKEASMTKEKFLKALKSSFNVEKRLIPALEKKMRETEFQLLIITGIGLVFPFIRSHTILNNLQRVASVKPTLIFYPGEFDGESLKLFNKLKDDNYYRAFNIENYEG